MEILQKVFKQTFWQIIGKFVSSISTIIILGIVARNYHESGTGLFTLVLTYLSMFFLIGDFGFNAHILKQMANDRSQVISVWRKLLGTRLVWSLILVIIAVGLLPFWPFANPEFNNAVIFGSLSILGSGIFISCNLLFQEKLRYDFSVLSSITGTIIYLLLVLFFAQHQSSLQLLVFSQAVGWLVIAITALFLIRKFASKIFPIFDLNYAKGLVKESWPIAATLALNVIYFRADSFMIAYFKGSAEVGIYNLAYQMFQSVLVLPAFIMNAYYPLMLKSLRGIKLVGSGLFFISLMGTIFTILTSSFFVNLLSGGGFSGSSQSLQILALGFPAYFLSALLMWLLVLKGKYKQMLLLYTSASALNLFLNFLFIPKYSFFAAAINTVICEYFILILQVIVLKRF